MASLEDGEDFDLLKQLTADYREKEEEFAEAGRRLRGEAARLARAGRKNDRRGQIAAIGRVTGWVREYISRLKKEVNDDGSRKVGKKKVSKKAS